MRKQLEQVTSLSETLNAPVVIAGDLFDKWNPPPQLIEFAVDVFQETPVWAIPGQHDLPQHNYDLMHKSAYGVLKAAKVVNNLPSYLPVCVNGIMLWGFPWGVPVKKPPHAGSMGGLPNVAIVHAYLWTGGFNYPGAKKETSVGSMKVLRHFDAAVFGDNHKGFWMRKQNTTILNCGTFMRRKSDEQRYQPMIGLVYDDGSVVPYPLLITDEMFVRNPSLDEVVPDIDMEEFLATMDRLSDVALNFHDIVERYVEDHELEHSVANAIRNLMVPF